MTVDCKVSKFLRRSVFLTCNKKKRLFLLPGKTSTTKNAELEDNVASTLHMYLLEFVDEGDVK